MQSAREVASLCQNGFATIHARPPLLALRPPRRSEPERAARRFMAGIFLHVRTRAKCRIDTNDSATNPETGSGATPETNPRAGRNHSQSRARPNPGRGSTLYERFRI